MDWKFDIGKLVLHAVETGEVPDAKPPCSLKRPAPPPEEKVKLNMQRNFVLTKTLFQEAYVAKHQKRFSR